MKKIICGVLALLMAASMAGCQSKTTETTPPTEKVTETTTEATTQATTEAPTEATISKEELNRFKAEESLAADSKTVTYKTPKEYETALHKMGFIEYNGDMVRLSFNGGVNCLPTSLTYNDEVFRMEFDYLDFVNREDMNSAVMNAKLAPVSGWVLYGKKNAAAADNISEFNRQDYGMHDTYSFGVTADKFHKVTVYHFNSSETEAFSTMAFYYPDTNNLYNLLNTQPNIADDLGMPDILCETEEAMSLSAADFMDVVNRGIVVPDDKKLIRLYLDFDNPKEGTLKEYPDGYIGTLYVEGMTFLEWMHSPYGDDHDWDIMGDMALFNPINWDFEENGVYIVTEINRPLDELVTLKSDGAVHLTMSLPDGIGFVPVTPDGSFTPVVGETIDMSALGDGVQYIPAP